MSRWKQKTTKTDMIPAHLAIGINPCSCGALATQLDLTSVPSPKKPEPMTWRFECHACGKKIIPQYGIDKAISTWNMLN